MLKHHPNEQSGAGLEALDGWTVVFDLDGTLVETAPDLHAALNHVLSLKGLAPVSLEDIRSMIGDGAKALIRKGLAQNGVTADEGEIEHALWPAFIEHYLANITRLSRPFDGVLAVLEALRAAGVGMAVCTNKAQGLADEVLKGLHLDHYFKACLGGDQASAPKPDGAHILETLALSGGQRQLAIMVGDSHTDERAARHAKLPFIFVTFGYGALSLEPITTTKIIDHWRSMPGALIALAQMS